MDLSYEIFMILRYSIDLAMGLSMALLSKNKAFNLGWLGVGFCLAGEKLIG